MTKVPKTRLDAVLIAGPTASGKSEIALRLALALQQAGQNAVIINADSMQVYNDLSVLTARPPTPDTVKVPHRLYGTISGSTSYSTGLWLFDLKRELARAKAAGLMPIITGGTGLYFKALLGGLSPVPDIPPDIRAFWRGKMGNTASPDLHKELQVRDPATAALLPANDVQRIVRALEVVDATGITLFEWKKQPGTALIPPAHTARFVIAPERDVLYQRCNTRFGAMVANGGLEEVALLMEKNYDPGLPIMRALGVRPLAAYLRRDIPLDEALETAKTETRRYAKRQLTWARGQMQPLASGIQSAAKDGWIWHNPQNREHVTQHILEFIELYWLTP